MTEVINFAEQFELRRICAAVMDATKRNETARASLTAGVIDAAKCDREIALVLEQLAKLKRDLDAAILRWPSMESEHVQAVG
jgi:hypothetical protein